MRPPFHLAIPVRSIPEARAFYGDVIGCREGRSAERWVDLDLYGHQLVVHLVDGYQGRHAHNPVDGDAVPIPHFGVVLAMAEWERLAERLRGHVDFVIEPHVRFQGEPGEQATMFFLDPSGNALEFKGFQDVDGQLFAT
ncbi:MAG: VOC family protein [Euryarchaeota archaeon]|nr:VOC family protein [Euryarchaeota archaeon]